MVLLNLNSYSARALRLQEPAFSYTALHLPDKFDEVLPGWVFLAKNPS